MSNVMGPKTILTLQRKVETADGVGGITETWSSLLTISGVLTSPSGLSKFSDELFRTLKETVRGVYVFFCDPPSIAITEKDRFIYGSRIFDIRFIKNPGEMNHHYEILLQELK